MSGPETVSYADLGPDPASILDCLDDDGFVSREAALVLAAALVEVAADTLDTDEAKCAGCGLRKYTNWKEHNLHEQIVKIPKRLRKVAADLRRGTTCRECKTPLGKGEDGICGRCSR